MGAFRSNVISQLWKRKKVGDQPLVQFLAEKLSQEAWPYQHTPTPNSTACYTAVEKTLSQLDPNDWPDALKNLYQQVLGLSSNSSHLQGDFEVFKHCILAKLTPMTVPLPPLSLESLWPEHIDCQKRYRTIIGSFFSQFTPVLSEEKVGYRLLQERLDQIERLSRLCLNPPQLVKTTESRPWFERWLTTLLNWLQFVFNVKVKVTERDYIEVADKLWHLIDQFPPEDPKRIKDFLESWYEKGQDECIEYSYFYEMYLKQKCWSIDLLSLVNWEQAIHSIIEHLQTDLNHIQHLGAFSLRLHKLKKIDYSEDYWDVYKLFRSRINQLSQAAYTIRMRLEKKQRSLKDTHLYLEKITLLDQALVAFHSRLEEATEHWLKEAELLPGKPDFYRDTNKSLRILNSRPVQALKEDFNWVHHTAYNCEETEKALKYEMTLRNKRLDPPCFDGPYQLNDPTIPNPGDVQACMTQSDWVVSRLKEYEEDINKLPPMDSNSSEDILNSDRSSPINASPLPENIDVLDIEEVETPLPLLSPESPPRRTLSACSSTMFSGREESIKQKCNNRISVYKTKAQSLAIAWGRSRWYNLDLGARPTTTPGLLAINPSQVSKPRNELTLMALVLHRKYIEYIEKDRPDLRKKLGNVPSRDQFFEEDRRPSFISDDQLDPRELEKKCQTLLKRIEDEQQQIIKIKERTQQELNEKRRFMEYTCSIILKQFVRQDIDESMFKQMMDDTLNNVIQTELDSWKTCLFSTIESHEQYTALQPLMRAYLDTLRQPSVVRHSVFNKLSGDSVVDGGISDNSDSPHPLFSSPVMTA